MRDILRLGLKLFAIAAIAGLLLGLTNALTEGPIEAQRVSETVASRQAVLPEAVTFEEAEAGSIEEAYYGLDAQGAVVGCTGKISVSGYGGNIAVVVGMRPDGTIAGVAVGGSDFQETVGLGAKTRDAVFTGQFANRETPVALKKDGGEIDAVTSATISSTAVVDGINAVCEQLKWLLAQGR